MSVDFNSVSLLLTRSRARNGQDGKGTPLFTITKGGALTLNNAFSQRWFKNVPKNLYYQIARKDGNYYLFISKEKCEGFYSLSKSYKTPSYHSRSIEAQKHLGVKRQSTSYRLQPIRVDNANVRGFLLAPYSAQN